ncbi:MAG: glycoside hydrolase family 88 protein [Ktedonobacteraceae bacterium]|nr:glycoside hydrolase family 88 protein [Ktedonobacteraceae bacterium]
MGNMMSNIRRKKYRWLAAIILTLSCLLGLISTGSVLAARATSGKLTASAPGAVCSVLQSAELADNYWIAQHPATTVTNNWQDATFQQGNIALYNRVKDATYYNYAEQWANAHKFLLQNGHTGPFFPDYQAVGQAYLDLYAIDNKPSEISDLRSRIASEVASVASGHISYWNYVDALNMSMPNFARLGVLDKSAADLSTMQTLFHYTEQVVGGHGLFNPSTGLWWRDHNYVNTTTYWSRGDGWAIMDLAKVLTVLPANDPRRAAYVTVFQQTAAALQKAQRSDGFWNVDLGNVKDFPGPESSGTAFFTYGIAWGINNGLLDAATYTPVVRSAWNALVTRALHPNGLLGYVQGPGSKPSDHQPIKATDTAPYAVGGFLLAGVQVAKLTPGC